MRGWSNLRNIHRGSSAILVSKRSLATGSRAGQEQGNNEGSQRLLQSLAAAAAAAAMAAAALDDRRTVSAKEETSKEKAQVENRVRQFQTPDMVFNYFASYRKAGSKGRWANLMSPMDVYSALTPDCSRFGKGHGDYIEVTDQDLVSMTTQSSKIQVELSPVKNSILNKIGKDGLLTYSDFVFLLALVSTPSRYIDTAFQVFDVNGNDSINLKEFAYISSKNALKSGGFGSYTESDQKEALESKSGLLNYLFGINKQMEVTKEQFKQLQKDLMDELIELQFLEYDKENMGRISEVDFANFLLKNGKIPKKKKATLLKNVKTKWPTMGQGITFTSFKNFFYILAGGGELERALFYLDVEGIGVDQAEFKKIASWVSGSEISEHVTDVVFTLLDDDGDKRLQRDELAHVLLDWRNSRGLDKLSLIEKQQQ